MCGLFSRSSKGGSFGITTAALLIFMQTCCQHFGVDYPFAHGVATVESGCKVNEVRVGPLGSKGKFIAPFGINKCFRDKWDIDNPYINIVVGVRALRGRDQRHVLQRYNAEFNEAYYRAVMACARQYRAELNQSDSRKQP